MKIVSYQIKTTTSIGLLVAETVLDLNASYHYLQQQAVLPNSQQHYADLPTEMIALLELGEPAWQLAQHIWQWAQSQATALPTVAEMTYPITAVTLLPPVLKPLKVIGLAFNYAAHAAEQQHTLANAPLIFHKTATALTGHHHPIQLPPRNVSQQIDYEGELAVIIGKTARHVDESRALDYVAGYCCANDVVARDIEAQTTWTNGAMLDTFCPLGPALVSCDEIVNPNQLALTTRVNGRTMQFANTVEMRFNVPQLISYLSSLISLVPGDVILTGTPAGIGASLNPPVFLQQGDRVEVEIEKIGTLSNPVQ